MLESEGMPMDSPFPPFFDTFHVEEVIALQPTVPLELILLLDPATTRDVAVVVPIAALAL
jgi:hypothetical protein